MCKFLLDCSNSSMELNGQSGFIWILKVNKVLKRLQDSIFHLWFQIERPQTILKKNHRLLYHSKFVALGKRGRRAVILVQSGLLISSILSKCNWSLHHLNSQNIYRDRDRDRDRERTEELVHMHAGIFIHNPLIINLLTAEIIK